MNLNDIPLFSAIRGQLSWLDARQRVIAQNVANSDTPGYGARDLKTPENFADVVEAGRGSGLALTSARHIPAPQQADARFVQSATPDSETTLDGNSVVVEEQMLKMAESRMAHDAAIGFYQKSLSMLRLAARPPGR